MTGNKQKNLFKWGGLAILLSCASCAESLGPNVPQSQKHLLSGSLLKSLLTVEI